MELLEILLSLYSPDLGQSPTRAVCFDRSLAVVYPTTPSGLPIDALAVIARRVIDSGVAEYNVALAGSELAANCVPLHAGGVLAGVVCAIENPLVAAVGRERLRFAQTAIAVFDAQLAPQFTNAAWDALAPSTTELAPTLGRVLETREPFEFSHGVARPFTSVLGTFRGVAVMMYGEAEQVRDRTALAEARLANRQKDQFIATVSHELRAPLAAMLLWEKVLRDEALDAATRMKALDAIHESATSQSQLVADLLDVSRAINGKLHIDKSPVALEELLEAVVNASRPSAEQRQVQVTCETSHAAHHVLGDVNRLRQVFANLVTNAIKCTNAGGKVTLRSVQREGMVEVSVEDTGVGIAPEVLPHLFEPFRQVSPARNGGLGLGLGIAAQLVMLHGGTIVASSAGLAKGATFRVTLPLASSRGAHVTPPCRPRLGGVHVLVVDDDRRIVEALQLLLERAGAVVETAGSADAGVGAVERAMHDVVLSDLAMPDGDGCSMIRRIRERESGVRRVPAVAMTAHVADANRQDALDAGFDRYITKPLDMDQLITTIARLVPR